MNRSAGVLLAIPSLPSKYGIGCFSKEAYDFVDWLADAKQTYWQILPLGPTVYEGADSPYQAYSAFAGNPYLIDLEPFIEQGLLEKSEIPDMNNKTGCVDYDKLKEYRLEILHKVYERSDISQNKKYQAFIEENNWWLHDYALFMALHTFFKDQWTAWPEDIRKRWGYSMDYYNRELYYDIEFQKFLQFTFFEQWTALKTYANKKGIQIVGDMPIYVSMDSSDVWAHPELFQINENNELEAIAGCPPDDFSETGQVWGNPLYKWDYHKQTGYDWWIDRIWMSFQLFDVLRIDHFRGLDEYFSIPAGATTGLEGHWEPGPNMDLFIRMEEKLGKRDLIAEDLGFMTDSVKKLVKDSGFPNMKVLQFAFDVNDAGKTNDYLPHNYPENCVAYTGTHDNDTSMGWYVSLSKAEKELVNKYIGKDIKPKDVAWEMIRLVFQSHAKIAIVPMQDYLGLDSKARMNLPATTQGNWGWRMKKDANTKVLAQKIAELTEIYGRVNWNIKK
ncbi:MAG: 4-alpha-glucanotransferase [Bacillota bacterium]|nr:4-alpha-glucanotransferase [Bacillota bacterium]